MKVILKEDINSLGNKWDVVKVADGYARNYLLPKRLALLATPQNLKNLQETIKVQKRKADILKEKAVKLVEELGSITCSFSHKAGDDGKLFGSVTSLDIEESLREKGYSIEKKDILLEEPIKKLGTFTVQARVCSGVKADIKINVVTEG